MIILVKIFSGADDWNYESVAEVTPAQFAQAKNMVEQARVAWEKSTPEGKGGFNSVCRPTSKRKILHQSTMGQFRLNGIDFNTLQAHIAEFITLTSGGNVSLIPTL